MNYSLVSIAKSVLDELAGQPSYYKVTISKPGSVCPGWQSVRVYCDSGHPTNSLAYWARQTEEERKNGGRATQLHPGRNGNLRDEQLNSPRESLETALKACLRNIRVKKIHVELAA